MKTTKAIGCPPLRKEPRGPAQRPRPPWPAVLAVALVAPAVGGCPGHLEELAWVDAGGISAPSGPPQVGVGLKYDAAPQPAPPPPAVDAAPAPPPMMAPPIDVNCATPEGFRTEILLPNCAGCHSGPAARAGLDLQSPGAKARLQAAAAKNPACAGKPLLSADGLSGVLLDKVQGMACGNQMPNGKPPLPPAAIQCIKDWAKPPAPPPPTVDKATCAQPTEIAAKILMPRCGSCHAGATAPAGLDLVAQGAKARLVNQAAKGPKSGCAGQVLSTADGAAGVIFNKLVGMGCGQQMPAAGPTLTNQQYWCIKEWIKPGAGGPFPEPAGYLMAVAAPPPPVNPMPPPMGPPPGKLDAGVPPPPPAATTCASPQEISDKILKPKCLPCHGAKMPSASLDLETPGAKARVLGVPAKGCANQILAKPDGTGLLFDKVQNMVPGGCGAAMPFGGLQPLTADEITCLKAWVGM